MARTRTRIPRAVDAEAEPPDRIDIHVGSRIRMRRLFLGMKQENLAQKLGLTFQQVQKYENGTNRVSASMLYAIAEVLEVRVAYFYLELDKTEYPTAEEMQWQQRIRQPEALELVRHYYAISDPRVREHFVELIKAATAETAN